MVWQADTDIVDLEALEPGLVFETVPLKPLPFEESEDMHCVRSRYVLNDKHTKCRDLLLGTDTEVETGQLIVVDGMYEPRDPPTVTLGTARLEPDCILARIVATDAENVHTTYVRHDGIARDIGSFSDIIDIVNENGSGYLNIDLNVTPSRITVYNISSGSKATVYLLDKLVADMVLTNGAGDATIEGSWSLSQVQLQSNLDAMVGYLGGSLFGESSSESILVVPSSGLRGDGLETYYQDGKMFLCGQKESDSTWAVFDVAAGELHDITAADGRTVLFVQSVGTALFVYCTPDSSGGVWNIFVERVSIVDGTIGMWTEFEIRLSFITYDGWYDGASDGYFMPRMLLTPPAIDLADIQAMIKPIQVHDGYKVGTFHSGAPLVPDIIDIVKHDIDLAHGAAYLTGVHIDGHVALFSTSHLPGKKQMILIPGWEHVGYTEENTAPFISYSDEGEGQRAVFTLNLDMTDKTHRSGSSLPMAVSMYGETPQIPVTNIPLHLGDDAWRKRFGGLRMSMIPAVEGTPSNAHKRDIDVQNNDNGKLTASYPDDHVGYVHHVHVLKTITETILLTITGGTNPGDWRLAFKESQSWADHGFNAGDIIRITGCTNAESNGYYILKDLGWGYVRKDKPVFCKDGFTAEEETRITVSRVRVTHAKFVGGFVVYGTWSNANAPAYTPYPFHGTWCTKDRAEELKKVTLDGTCLTLHYDGYCLQRQLRFKSRHEDRVVSYDSSEVWFDSATDLTSSNIVHIHKPGGSTVDSVFLAYDPHEYDVESWVDGSTLQSEGPVRIGLTWHRLSMPAGGTQIAIKATRRLFAEFEDEPYGGPWKRVNGTNIECSLNGAVISGSNLLPLSRHFVEDLVERASQSSIGDVYLIDYGRPNVGSSTWSAPMLRFAGSTDTRKGTLVTRGEYTVSPAGYFVVTLDYRVCFSRIASDERLMFLDNQTVAQNYIGDFEAYCNTVRNDPRCSCAIYSIFEQEQDASMQPEFLQFYQCQNQKCFELQSDGDPLVTYIRDNNGCDTMEVTMTICDTIIQAGENLELADSTQLKITQMCGNITDQVEGPKNVPVDDQSDYTWAIVLGSVVGAVAVGVAIYLLVKSLRARRARVQ